MPSRVASYEGYREGQAAISRQRSLSGRDIGPVPDIASARRRGRCRKSLRWFCETYNPEAFGLPWNDDHLSGMARIEEAAQHGALYAFAWSRGSGKTMICRMAALWAVSYGWCRYVFVIGANEGKAADTLAAVKTFIRFLPLYAADFPEIAHAANALGGIANRAAGQLCQGEPTLIEWSRDRIVLPTVPPPENWPRSWPLRGDGMAPTSGSVVSASGLTGDGIRGSLLTLTTGASLRPDLVLLDDPQSSESAHSPAQNASREQLIAADVLGMAGPGRAISAVMPCTVIAMGDMVDNLLDRTKHPLWRGQRAQMLRSMPSDLNAWEPYFELYRRCALREPPDFKAANAYYLQHQAALETGAEASWPARKLPGEVSAIQHAMHLYDRDKRAFYAEYQNQPLPLTPPEPNELKPDDLAARLNRCPRGVVPPGSTRLTAGIDVQGDLLYYVLCAWQEGFGGAVVDWGSWPNQQRAYFTLADARPTLAVATGVPSLEGSIYAGLGALTAQLLGQEWPLQGGGVLKVERCLIDSGWGLSTEVVMRFCRQSPHAAVLMPSKGVGIGPQHSPIGEWPKKPGERRGANWVIRPPTTGETRRALYDTNAWKTFVAARLRQPMGEAGGLTLFGDDPTVHKMFADHCVSEFKVKTFGRGREVECWSLRPHRPENHLWDALIECAVAASILGIEPPGVPKEKVKERKKVSYKAMQDRARNGS